MGMGGLAAVLGRISWRHAHMRTHRVLKLFAGQARPRSAKKSAKSVPRAAKSGPRAVKHGPTAAKNTQERPKSGQELP